MFRKALQALAVGAFVALPLAASAQYNGDTLLQSQTVIQGSLEQTINSKTAQVGDPFVLDVTGPYPNDDQRYAGAKVYGHVASVTHAGGMKKGAVQLAFDRLTLADGTTASLQGQVLSLDAQGNRANTTSKAIIGGAVGQVLGNFIGKHIGTDIGGAVGMIGGAIVGAATGQNVQVPQGSTVALKTTAPSTVLSRRQPGYPNNGGYYNNGGYNNNNNNAPTPYPTPYH
ncbi:MAG TPA: hypothetical protein VGN14_13485 [Candidatus Elarobacter sp.]|jgi:hypothetical protein